MLNRIKSNYSLGLLLLGTLLVYSKVWGLGFTNWDDTLNVTENNLITDFSFENIKKMFSSSFIGMYVPLTMLSYSFDYLIAGLNPKVFHITNLALHLLNIFLVYQLLICLKSEKWMALAVTLLFAVHPMNVECVAWVSGRSTLLYTCFIIAGLLSYIKYLNGTPKQIYFSLLFFLLALLSKSSAIIFPVLLFAVDFYFNKKLNFKSKIAFIALALLFGGITIAIRTPATDTVTTATTFSFLQRGVLALYSPFFYISKLLLPVSLCIYYPYPEFKQNALPSFYFIFPFLVALIVWGIYKFKTINKELVVGLSIFILPVLLVSQIIPFESVNFVADRYAYLPSIGFFFAVIHVLRYLISSRNSKNTSIYIITSVLLFSIIFSVLSFKRVGIWKDSVTLFTDMITKNKTLPYPYHSRGHELFMQNKLNEAVADFDKALQLKPDYFEASYNRGLARYSLSDIAGAISDFDRAAKLMPEYAKVYYSRGLARSIQQKYGDAIADFDLAEKNGFKTSDLYINRGNSKYNLTQFNEALKDYLKSLEVQPDNVLAWDHIGPTKYNLKDFAGAEEAYTKSIELNTSYKDAYCDRGIIRGMLNNFKGAIDDFTFAINLNLTDAMAYYNRGLAHQKNNDLNAACFDWKKAVELGYKEAQGMVIVNCK